MTSDEKQNESKISLGGDDRRAESAGRYPRLRYASVSTSEVSYFLGRSIF